MELSKWVNKTWMILLPDGKLVVTIPQFMWLGILIALCGMFIFWLGIYIVLLTTRGV